MTPPPFIRLIKKQTFLFRKTSLSPMEVRFFSLIKCPPCANFDRSHDGSATIFNFGPIGAKKGYLGPKRTL